MTSIGSASASTGLTQTLKMFTNACATFQESVLLQSDITKHFYDKLLESHRRSILEINESILSMKESIQIQHKTLIDLLCEIKKTHEFSRSVFQIPRREYEKKIEEGSSELVKATEYVAACQKFRSLLTRIEIFFTLYQDHRINEKESLKLVIKIVSRLIELSRYQTYSRPIAHESVISFFMQEKSLLLEQRFILKNSYFSFPLLRHFHRLRKCITSNVELRLQSLVQPLLPAESVLDHYLERIKLEVHELKALAKLFAIRVAKESRISGSIDCFESFDTVEQKAILHLSMDQKAYFADRPFPFIYLKNVPRNDVLLSFAIAGLISESSLRIYCFYSATEERMFVEHRFFNHDEVGVCGLKYHFNFSREEYQRLIDEDHPKIINLSCTRIVFEEQIEPIRIDNRKRFLFLRQFTFDRLCKESKFKDIHSFIKMNIVFYKNLCEMKGLKLPNFDAFVKINIKEIDKPLVEHVQEAGVEI